MKINIKFLLLSLFSATVLFSCKKETQMNLENQLVGNWQEIEINRSLKFTKDHLFAFSIADSVGAKIIYAGTYLIKGDSLDLSTKEVLEQQPGKTPVSTPSKNKLYEKATFDITGNKLTIKYISYPADGPVSTTGKFLKSPL
ncbi:MAG: hypothetical protein ACOH2A_12165 [Sphingobacteriaceae bacterium]